MSNTYKLTLHAEIQCCGVRVTQKDACLGRALWRVSIRAIRLAGNHLHF